MSKRKGRQGAEEQAMKEVACVASHFLDSGAFTLWTKAAEYAKQNKCGRWDYYDTAEFWEYMDAYAAFIKKHQIAIDLYANVDVIPNPELTWRNQRYLEKKHGLRPVPVVHYTTNLKWLEKYIDKGYEIIGLGGLVGSTSQDACRRWIDDAFEIVCNTKDHLPRVKIHGFGVTDFDLLRRYPWYSVDSASWTKVGSFGGIFVPHKRRGQFTFDEQPYIMKMSDDSPEKKIAGSKHYHTLSVPEKVIVRDWLKEIDIPLGESDADGKPVVYGVINHHIERKMANLFFFERLRASLPEYPWAFQSRRRKRSFGL